jgi:uncharacterized membrane protein YhaH (DUF805 family)
MNKTQIDPDAALDRAIKENNLEPTVAGRVPKLRQYTYILIAYIVISVLQMFAFFSFAQSMGQGTDMVSQMLTLSTFAFWIIGIVLCIVLLRAKSTSTVRTLLIVLGVMVGFDLIRELAMLQVIGIIFDAIILWLIYDLYKEVSDL